MEIISLRLLIAEDYELFRNLYRAIIEPRPELQIVAEACDGLQALQMAAELKPDMILLDIGLPLLNGFDAARLIRKLAPDSKIIFLSQELAPEVVQEAFNLGASAYVMKATAASDLLAAIDAVRVGGNFVSRV